jgi:hypothetical protein
MSPSPEFATNNEHFMPAKTSKLTIISEHKGWVLCQEAEERARRALVNDMVIVVNNHLLVKMLGKMSAICTETVKTSDGKVFNKGYWYSPCDNESRKRIEEQFEKGFTRIDLTSGDWLKMRLFMDEELLENTVVRTQTMNLKYSGPMTLAERKRLRKAEREPFIDNRLDLGTGN